ncbi:MAG: hypothetical protein ACTHLW_21040 [Verrucomicrobiota bacterium]
MKAQMQILTFHESGIITALDTRGGVDAEQLGMVKRTRASHIWPAHPVKRAAFRILRRLFGESGRVATWLRQWRGPWEVRFVDPLAPRRIGAVVFSHISRRVCVAWEIEQLNGKV